MKFWYKFESRCHLVSFQFYSDCAPDLTCIKVFCFCELSMNYEVKKQMVDGQRKQLRSTEKACPEEGCKQSLIVQFADLKRPKPGETR
ncbi:hypothetical protein HanIR_Chr04g0154861 [Helianthus annuus]|nr:hypothetical protein HanIR_Chr04g0154861 [Helianthus annuus]